MAYDVSITRLPLFTLFDLKGGADALRAWCGPALPALPARPTRALTAAGRTVVWTGPDHWLMRADLAEEAALYTALRPDDAPGDISIVQVSDTLVFFAITGPDAGDVMAVATPLDLHPDLFPPDAASWSEAFGTKALIRPIADGFELAVDRSYADWVEAMLGRTAS
ncbi:MAG: sarcosine oxidase subunit gamma [Rhodobacteraceae bacterium]|nr:sarcosine oxidase subunit gamma [Paracoccaceae bacterium]